MIDRRKLNAAHDIDRLARNEELKRVMKEAIGEWLDAQFLRFGKWSFYSFLALAVASLLWLILASNGWHKP